MKRSHRHTIMDGRVVTFATDFVVPDDKPFSMADAVGPFEVSASGNAVVVHQAELRTYDDLSKFKIAVELAWNEHTALSCCYGRPDDGDSGEPRSI